MRKRWNGLLVALSLVAVQVVVAPQASGTTIPPGSVHVESNQSNVDTATSKAARANCPAGQRAVGGGVLTTGGAHVVVTELRPISDAMGDGFTATAAADQFGVIGTWAVTVFTYCATPPPGLEVVPKTNPPSSQHNDQVQAFCSPGKNIIGSGGRITGGGGQVDLSLSPNNSQGVASASSASALEDADGFDGNYQVTSYAICATMNQFPDFQLVRASSPNDTTTTKKVFVSCPNGYRLTGGAAGVGIRGAHVQFFRPNLANAPSLIEASATTGVSLNGNWAVDAVAYCAR
jgi:hypothetical protein